MQPESVKVSVLMRTFNQQDFVSSAIESVLRQKVDFRYELVIGDDCSTDGTREVLRRYQEENPGVIRLLLNEKNIGYQLNLINILDQCRGQYVAILDGDDYWLTENKLQLQTDFLDQNPECVIHFADAVNVEMDGITEIGRHVTWNQKPISGFDDLITSDFLVTCTVLFRNGLIDKLPDWFSNMPSEDWILYLELSKHGKIAYLDDQLAVYRQSNKGVYSGLSNIEKVKRSNKNLRYLQSYLDNDQDFCFEKRIHENSNKLEKLIIENGVSVGLSNPKIDNVLKVLKEWPEEIPRKKNWRAQILRQIYESLLFLNYEENNMYDARYCWWRLLQYAPFKLTNRGTLSIGLKAFTNL